MKLCLKWPSVGPRNFEISQPRQDEPFCQPHRLFLRLSLIPALFAAL